MLFIKEYRLFNIGRVLSAQKGYHLEKYLQEEQANNLSVFDSRGWKDADRGRNNDTSKQRTEKGRLRLNHLIKKIVNCSGSSDFAGFEIAFGMRRQ